jgi:hypothetical protein
MNSLLSNLISFFKKIDRILFYFYNEKFLNKLCRKEYQRIFNNIKLFNLNSLNTFLVIKLRLNESFLIYINYLSKKICYWWHYLKFFYYLNERNNQIKKIKKNYEKYQKKYKWIYDNDLNEKTFKFPL